ncbi:MAG: hypothetical protein E7166_06515 [Firmicutes bacterium]|nr:hypothetical protein [Bacillota bacterium]
MEKEATKIFEIVLNNKANLTSEIKMQVYKLLDLEGKTILPNANENTRLLEQIQASIETFAFNLQETQFLNQVQEIIKEEMQKLQTSGNYALIESSLIERLKGLRNIDISLESDFKDLSSKIANSFHSQDEYYNYFMAREEKIANMIKSYNQSIINSLINLTPKLMEELKSEKEKQPVSQETKQNAPSDTLDNITSDINSKRDDMNNMNKIDGLINACKNRYNELQRRFSYLTSGATSNINSSKIMLEKEEIRKALKQLTELIQKLSASKYANDLMSKYADIKDMDLFYEKIISEIAPSSISATNMTNVVNNMYSNQFTTSFNQFSMTEVNVDELHKKIVNTNNLTELLNIKQQIEKSKGSQYYDTNIRLETELTILVDKIVALTMRNSKSQDPNNPMLNAQIGESKEDIMVLINSNNFYGILQSIQSHNVEKYRDFIMLGFNTIINRWQQQASMCNSFEKREKSYQDFVELYENFKDYLPMDVGNMLKTNLEEMTKYIEQQRAKHTEIEGVRYNNSEEQINQNTSSIKI